MDQDAKSAVSGSQHTSPSSMQAPHSNVYVKNLPDDMDDNSLRELFEDHGLIKSACVMLDQATKKSRNFGFVKFVEIESAQAAIQALNNTELQGKKLMVKFADADAEDKPPGDQCPSDNLYIKGLPPSFTHDEIYPIFSRLGNVMDIKILSRPGVGSTGKALVRMENSGQASWAISELNGKILEGCSGPVVVRYADSPDEKQNKRKNNLKRNERFAASPHMGDGYPMPIMAMQDPFRAPPFLHGPPMARAPEICNLYVNELPSDADDLFLYRNFAPFGAITSVRVMRDENGNSRGFGFVKFVHAHDAVLAMSSLNGKQVNGKYLHVSPKTTSKGQANQFPPEFPLSPSVPPHPMLGHCVPLPQPPQPMMGHMPPFAIPGMQPARHIMPTTSL